jgi:predicted phage terminase large subunit-like protein
MAQPPRPISPFEHLRLLRAHAQENRTEQLARTQLLAFTLYTFDNYEIGWHHRIMCQALNRFVSGELKRLMVFMPPRHGKSELVSRRLPAFILGCDPTAQIIATSYSADLASRMNRDVQRIIDTPAYAHLFPDSRLHGKNIRSVAQGSWLRNSDIFEIVNHGGTYRSAGVGGGITGMGGNRIIIDDPIKNQEEANSVVYREKLWEWYTSTLYTRLEKDAGICLTLTRWHEDDLAGRLLKLADEDPAADQWTVINFPAICESAENKLDPREIGEPLWPEKYNAERLAGLRASVGSRIWTALYQQRPAPDEGIIVNREWWRYYTTLPDQFDTVVQSWDLTFTGKETSDFVCGGVLGRKGADIYLLDIVHDRLSFTESIAAITNLARKWPQATAKYVEETANGYAAIDTLRSKVPGLIAVKPMGSKVARANAVAPRIEAGNVWLPDPSIAPWSRDIIEEWTAFPASAHDDIVDMMTQGIIKLGNIPSTDWSPLSIKGTNLWKY